MMWKKRVLVSFKALSGNSFAGTEEEHEIFSQVSRCPEYFLYAGQIRQCFSL
jgi:hypothetical protein